MIIHLIPENYDHSVCAIRDLACAVSEPPTSPMVLPCRDNNVLRYSLVHTINPFPALIKSKNLLNIDHFCFYFISSRWSAVSVNHSIPPESVMNRLQDGGGFIA